MIFNTKVEIKVSEEGRVKTLRTSHLTPHTSSFTGRV